ncbi:MAG: hypothetical protein BMS9Abin37_1680 [Acidobacteriota bacterium]|nr:MAG: hypothetical protein BMS9Abin37_1680 [Acidobacteriota bacterium]
MHSKPPSSLDYDGHLHELALNNWRRALRERDVSRAEINARDPDGDVERAREAYSQFLHLWRDGEIDREAVAKASQFVKS